MHMPACLFISISTSSPAFVFPHFHPPQRHRDPTDALQQPRRPPPSPPAAAMRKATIFLMALALALAVQALTAPATPLPPLLRRSRFLATANLPPPPPSFYDCRKKPPSICLAEGSPGATCCKGACVDTEYNFQHCGNCGRTCKYGQTCCGGKCVNTVDDVNNCGECGIRCRTNCTSSYCDYAA